MIGIERAVEIVMSAAAAIQDPQRNPVESVHLTDALSRILRESVVADADSPPFDKSIRDGFAVRSEDVRAAPTVLKIIGESRAGQAAVVDVIPGTCVEIMTGAPLPQGANAVVMVEHTEHDSSGTVRILKRVQEGVGLLRRGAEAIAGDRILSAGQRIGLADVGLLASVGKSRILVSKKPRVAIVATGDELVELEQTPQSGQIRNSNSYTLHAQVASAGAEPVLLGVAKDDRAHLRDQIGQALEHDIALVSGGVSMGKYDLVEDVLGEFGVKALFDSVAMKPGKPTVFGYRGSTFVFGLPGNPVSTIVSFHMFVRPLILHLLQAEEPLPRMLEAEVEAAAKCDPERTALVPALVRFASGGYKIRTAPWKGSSDLVGLSKANALILIPSREGNLSPGDMAQFLFLE